MLHNECTSFGASIIQEAQSEWGEWSWRVCIHKLLLGAQMTWLWMFSTLSDWQQVRPALRRMWDVCTVWAAVLTQDLSTGVKSVPKPVESNQRVSPESVCVWELGGVAFLPKEEQHTNGGFKLRFWWFILTEKCRVWMTTAKMMTLIKVMMTLCCYDDDDDGATCTYSIE